jgi:predicted GH43/DUF377 family glycosyl hydrolase
MFRWVKLGQLFDPREPGEGAWIREFAQSPSTVIFEDHVRVYFCARPAPDMGGQYRSYVTYLELDRGNLKDVRRVCDRPVLDLGRPGTFDEFGTYPVSVIRFGDEIRAYYAGITRCESVPMNAAIGVAISRDGGESFERLGNGPVLSFSPDEPFMLGSPRVRRFNGEWHLWYVAGKAWLRTDGKPEPVYKIRMASSRDGIEWVKRNQDLIPDRLGPEECQACPDVTFRNGRYHMFYSYRESHDYWSGPGGYKIGYASSEDMITWHRDDELAGMRPSAAGWDSEMACYPHVFVLGAETFMLYQGNRMGRAGFGLARLEASDEWGDR